MIDSPRLITFPKIGIPSLGYISVAENENLPFPVNRIYWTYFTPEDVERGGHAHYNLEQILIAVAGKITVGIELTNGQKFEFILDNPDRGLYIPKSAWRTLKYTHNAVQLCIASRAYEESDYIRDYDTFAKINFQ